MPGARPTQDFLRGPNERTTWTFILCPCPGGDLARPVYGWSLCLLRWVKETISGDQALPPGLWLSVLRQLCVQNPGFSLPRLPDLALLTLTIFPSANKTYDTVLLNNSALAWVISLWETSWFQLLLLLLYFLFSLFLNPGSLSWQCHHSEPISLKVLDSKGQIVVCHTTAKGRSSIMLLTINHVFKLLL